MAKTDIVSEAYKRDPFPTLTRMVEQGPLVPYKIPFFGTMQLVTTYDAALDLLKDRDRFAVDGRNAGKSSQLGMSWLPKSMKLLGENMLSHDDPTHRRLRKLVDGPFKTQEIEKLRPAVVQIADALLDEVAASDTPDLVDGFCRRLPLAVICEMLGLPNEDRPRFEAWMDTMSDVASGFGIFKIMPMIRKLSDYLREQFELRRADPQPGLITELVKVESEEDRLSEDELLAMVFVLFIAGHETTTHLLSTSIETLMRHPETLETLKADGALWPAFVEESLRYNSPVQMTKPRYAKEDLEFHGVPVKRGERFMAMLASGNMDPAKFEDSTRFDLTREKNRHLGFGGGMHLCLGLQLARMEAQVGLARLFERWPALSLAVPADQLHWHKRIGMRGLKALPLALDQRVPIAA